MEGNGLFWSKYLEFVLGESGIDEQNAVGQWHLGGEV